MSKKFFQIITASLGCLMALATNDGVLAQQPPKYECASVEVRSPGNQYKWYNFTYTNCKTGQKALAQSYSVGPDEGEPALAFSNEVAVGTTVDMGQWGMNSHMTPPGDVVRKGENKYVCNNNGNGVCQRVQ